MNPKMSKLCKQLFCGGLTLAMLLAVVPVLPASAAEVTEVTESLWDKDFDAVPKNTNGDFPWVDNGDGTYTAPADVNPVMYYLNRDTSYHMSNYTFQADVTLPMDMADTTQLGGIAFGIMDGYGAADQTSRYEFTISYVPAVDATEEAEATAAGWATRLYKRSDNVDGETGYVLAGSHTRIKDTVTLPTDKAEDLTFTMKVVLNALNIKCYIDDTLIFNYTVTDETDTSLARGAVTGGVGLLSFKNTPAVFSNMKLSGKSFGTCAPVWESTSAAWIYDLSNSSAAIPAGNINQALYADKTASYGMTDYVFEVDVTLTEDAYNTATLGGIVFGVKDGEKCTTSRYEYTVSAVTDSEGNLGWAPRVYKRTAGLAEGYSDKGYICAGAHTEAISGISISKGESFNMKVILKGLKAYCYIDDVQVLTFSVTDEADANYVRGAITGGVGLIGFNNSVAIFDNVKVYYEEYKGYTQNFDELGSNAADTLKTDGWRAGTSWGNAIASEPLNVGELTEDGKLLLEAKEVLGLVSYTSPYVDDAAAMTDYTFEAQVTVPAVTGITNYGYLGIGFGFIKNSSNKYVGYEFSIHPTADADGNVTWKARVYDRANGTTVVAEKAVSGVTLALDQPFTQKVVLDGAKAYCYIDDVLFCVFSASSTITGAVAVMGANSGTASVLYDDIKLEKHKNVCYEENFDSLTASSAIATTWKQLDSLNDAWFADAATDAATLGAIGQFRALWIGEDGDNKFLQTYHSNYSYLFDTEHHNSNYEFETDIIYTGKGTDGAAKAPVSGDFFGVFFGLNDVDTSDSVKLSGYEFMLLYNGTKWQARLYNRVDAEQTPSTAYVELPESVAAKIENGEAIRFKVALHGDTAYCYLDGIPVIAHTDAGGAVISGDIGMIAHSKAAEAADRPLVNIDNFKFMAKAESKPTCKVSFVAGETVVKEITVNFGSGLTDDDIPAVPEMNGCTGVWEDVDLTKILSDITVNAIYSSSIGVEKWSLTLGDDIGANFYVTVNATDVSATAARITVCGETTTILAANAEIQDGYYVFSANVAAAQMTDVIGFELVVNDESVWTNEYTVAAYAAYILDEANDFDDVTKALVKEMLNYGAAAQNYFSYNLENTIDSALYADAGTVEVDASAAPAMSVDGSVTGVKYYGSALLFESKTAVRFYFSGDVSGCSFTYGEQELKPVEKNGMWYVEIAEIAPQQLGEAVTVTVSANGEALNVSYSPMNYIVRMSEKGSDTLKDLLKALYNYHLAAVEYAK